MGPKAKKEKMSLGTFLTNENYGSWADEMEDMPLPSSESRTGYGGGERRAFSSAGGMGNGSFDRPLREELPLPNQPPYTAHIGNMSFDATSADVTEFFKDCAVTNVRIVEDKLDHKPKGFGYVEFGTLDGLKKALSYGGSSLGGRQIRVSVAEPPKDRQDGRDFSDWSRKGPLPDLPQSQRRVSDRPTFGRPIDSGGSDAGSDRAPSRRGFGGEGDGKVRDFGNWERKGPLSPVVPAAASLREGGRQKSRDGQQFRHNSPAWGEGRSQEGSRPPRREFQERPQVERVPTAAERDNQWRTSMRPDAPAKSPTPTQSRETSNPPSPAQPPAPASRPKLNLQKRTVSEAVPAASPTAEGESKASPFGAARPVDTFAKEREIEEKRELAIRQKKEADDKARAEKAEEKRLAKEAKDKAIAEKASNEKSAPTGTNGAKETDSEAPPVKSNFEILRRASEGPEDMTANDDTEGAEDNDDNENDEEEEEGGEEEDDEEDEEDQEDAATIVEDKEVKPKAIVRDAPSSKANGAWRNGSSKDGKVEGTSGALEEDGWSTIPTKPRNNRRGNQGSRAIAS